MKVIKAFVRSDAAAAVLAVCVIVVCVVLGNALGYDVFVGMYASMVVNLLLAVGRSLLLSREANDSQA